MEAAGECSQIIAAGYQHMTPSRRLVMHSFSVSLEASHSATLPWGLDPHLARPDHAPIPNSTGIVREEADFSHPAAEPQGPEVAVVSGHFWLPAATIPHLH